MGVCWVLYMCMVRSGIRDGLSVGYSVGRYVRNRWGELPVCHVGWGMMYLGRCDMACGVEWDVWWQGV